MLQSVDIESLDSLYSDGDVVGLRSYLESYDMRMPHSHPETAPSMPIGSLDPGVDVDG
ncbi:hypothetical protein SCLCIDRAFT_1216604 [Scleroderma citrinum Foug A]|uniref:Uncharacterized protein n=1 Tax=Scleroderma citrinum Foug A TaxID=1036808 RepID=A0A0C3A797_9AGAM|nr:hypothetical protein SCLCIDRAFT_1216604 [Scleroderma citrinum Foug A]